MSGMAAPMGLVKEEGGWGEMRWGRRRDRSWRRKTLGCLPNFILGGLYRDQWGAIEGSEQGRAFIFSEFALAALTEEQEGAAPGDDGGLAGALRPKRGGRDWPRGPQAGTCLLFLVCGPEFSHPGLERSRGSEEARLELQSPGQRVKPSGWRAQCQQPPHSPGDQVDATWSPRRVRSGTRDPQCP